MDKKMVIERGETNPEIVTEPTKTADSESQRLDKIDKKLNAILKALGVSTTSLEDDTDEAN